MAETNLPATKRARKSKPKVRALKDYRPTLFIDIERAEALASEIDGHGLEICKLFNEFMHIVRDPFYGSRRGDKDLYYIEHFAKNVRHCLGREYSTFLHTINSMPDTLDAAIAALKVLKRITEVERQEQERLAATAE